MIKMILHKVFYKKKLLWLLLILSSSQLYGQSALFGAPPGDNISEATNPISSSTSSYKVVEQKHKIIFSLKGAIGFNETTFYTLESSPIVFSGFKNGSTEFFYVLLEDGTLYKLAVHNYQTNLAYSILSKDKPNPTGSAGSVDFDKITGDALYILSSAGVYVSRDSANTWQIDTTGLGSASILDIELDPAQYVYAATSNGLYVQNPDSNVWNQIQSSAFGFFRNFAKVFIDRHDRIFLAGNNGGMIYMSTDHGSTWSVDTTGIGGGFQIFNAFGDDVYGNIYAATTNLSATPNSIFKSAGGTSPWVRIDQGITAITVNSPVINSINGDSTLYAGTSFGLYQSTDQGVTWTEDNTGIPAETFNGFAKSKNGRLITSTALAIYTQEAGDTTWTKRFPVNGYEANLPIYQDGLGNLYTVEQGKNSFGNIVKSTDNGTTWAYDTVGLSSIDAGPFYVDGNGTEYICSVDGNPSRAAVFSKKIGGNWTVDTSGALSSVAFAQSISSDQKNLLYMSVYWNTNIGSQSQGVVCKPINGGAWAIDSTGLPPFFNYFYQMAPDKNGIMYGEDYFYLLDRTNSGWTSVPVPQQIPGSYYTAFSFDSSNTLYAALENYSYLTGFSSGLGVYYTTNSGTSWTYAGLDSIEVNQLLSYGNITYAVADRGIYSFTHGNTTAVKSVKQLPLHYELSQNYPNPFNPTTIINYQIAKGGLVTIKIYDILGREVNTLVNEYKSSGNYSESFDAGKLASGVYFYQMKVNNYTFIKKLVLLK